MDLLKKITDELEPLGGELLMDRFLQARAAGEVAATQTSKTARTAPVSTTPRAETVRMANPRPQPRAAAPETPAEPGNVTDTGKLRAEVQAFLNREEAEGTDDSEVQEFLQERKGFDPSELA